MPNNQNEGNAAEHLVCYELLRRGVPAWILGGNNRRWDLLFQVGEDKFLPGQVKMRSRETLVFKSEDSQPTEGVYFIWYKPSMAASQSFLKEKSKEILDEGQEACLLVFDSAKVQELCRRSATANSPTGRVDVHLGHDDIVYGLEQQKRFWTAFSFQ